LKYAEHAEQVALIQWAVLAQLPSADDVETGSSVASLLFAVPNGGRRNLREAARLKMEGVKAGVWDLFLPLARRGRHGLWLELKSPKGVMSPEQRRWGAAMTSAGYETVVCRSFDQARAAIESYLGMR
jgi:hypothetical protein